ncbi:hypothetical protein [Deinococcus humi]|uniref:DNA-binding transcriptional regulator YdaS (Cro superfamily) n=1 Tax=Deinococcus humi TaxID=662880 RepID=A0A7W8NFF5_9DEIO|nr:hypothetical protein [Deinococcus humi]MBB5365369.1 DNA-binding transcriptional regulator YdaS (Cro superfamily) [Deinococcus humi]
MVPPSMPSFVAQTTARARRLPSAYGPALETLMRGEVSVAEVAKRTNIPVKQGRG